MKFKQTIWERSNRVALACILCWVCTAGVPAVYAQIPQAPRPDESTPSGFASVESLPPFGLAPSTNFHHPNLNVTSPSLTWGRSSLQIQSAIQPVANRLAPHVVKIVGQYDRTTLGTVVSRDGLIVSKYSELTKEFFCILPDGKKLPGRLIGIHPQNDLALIEVSRKDLQPVVFTTQTTPETASLVVSIGFDGHAAGFGMVSTEPQVISIKQPECEDCRDMGVDVSAFAVKRARPGADAISGLEVYRVQPRTMSESLGVLVGDLLHSINGSVLLDREQLSQLATSFKVGQTIELGLYRKGQYRVLKYKVKQFASRTTHDQWGGGPFSARRFGFREVIAHDSIVPPESCGGPLVDLEGRFIGINIARSMRVATFAIPVPEIYHFVKYVRPQADMIVKR